MKKLTIIFGAALLFLWSCENDISTNNLLSSYLNINAGDNYEVCYQKLQQLYADDQINLLFVDNVSFTSIGNFNEQKELYSEFQITEKAGDIAGDRISFYFNTDTLQYLLNIDDIDPLTSGPTQLESWPDISETANAIKVGDNKDTINNKLTRLLAEGILNVKMNKISYTIKDLSTPFDENTKNSYFWTILKSYSITDEIRTYFILHFLDGVVQGIEILEVPVVGMN
jgi:hypothetical protein